MKRILHHAFTMNYSNITRELFCDVIVKEPLITYKEDVFRSIWDTGATNTVISSKVVESLGLKPIDKVRMSGVNSVVEANVYLVDLYLPNNVRIQSLNVAEGSINNCDVLIGMDVITIGDMAISNHGGQTKFTFSFPPHHNRADYVERSNKLNKLNQ